MTDSTTARHPAHAARGRSVRARGRLLGPWTSQAGLVAVLVLAVQLVWRGALLSKGFFGQDDFLVLADAARFTWEGLGDADHVGGFSPGAALVAWAHVTWTPLSWGTAAMVVLGAQTVAGVLMWLVLTRLLGDRWLRVPLLALFCFSPLTLWATQWWSVGVQFWPATAALLLGIWALLVVLHDGDRALLSVVLAALVVALAFSQNAVLHPLVLAGVALVAVPGATLRTRASSVFAGLRSLWIGVAIVLAGYGVVRVMVAPVRFGTGPDLGEVVTTHVRLVAAELWGGPWSGSLPGHAYLVPPTWAVGVGGALLLALVGVTLQRGGISARAAWLLFAVHGAAVVALLTVLGQGEMVGSLGLIPRLAAEVAPVFVVCAAGALSGVSVPAFVVRGRPVLGEPRAEPALGLFLLAATLVATGVSTAFLAPNLYHEGSRSYVTALRESLRAEPRVVLVDSPVPAEVISPWFAGRARVSEVVGYAPENPVFDIPSSRLRLVNGDGTLAGLELAGPVSMRPSGNESCGYPVRADGLWIPLESAVPPGRWVVRMGYYTSAETFAAVQVADDEIGFAVNPGLHVIYFEVSVEGAVEGVHVALADARATMCVSNVDVGLPRAAIP
jgi:hypothetical protein